MASHSYEKLNSYFPLLFRYFLKVATLNFLLVVATFILLLTLASFVFYLNQAKVFTLSIALEYTLSTVALSFEFILPLIVVFSFYLTARFFFKRKFHIVFPSLGISLKTFLPLIVTLASINSFLILVYFEFFYPKAAYNNYVSYLKSKNKVPQSGIVKHFWYKNTNNQFVYFQIISLHDKKALNGKVFKLDKNFNLIWVENIPTGTVFLKEKTLTVKSTDVIQYQTDKVLKLENYSINIPYQEKFFKIKTPKFFSLIELIQLLSYVKRFGLNTVIYLWELEKRILLIVFVFIISVYSFLVFFGKASQTSKSDNFSEILKVFLFIFSFYLFLVLFQVLVDKISLNPLYGIAILVPYLGLLIKKWKSI